jgi:hypothetical protein
VRSYLDSPDDDGDLFLAYMLMNKQIEDETESDSDSKCYLCNTIGNLESARFPDSSTLVCVDCSVSWQHEMNLQDEWRLEESEV